jgi:hypothetical protein
MVPPHTMQLAGRADWALMIAIHDALRRDLDQLLHPTAGHASARARRGTFRSQLRFHLADERAAMWPRVKAKLAATRTARPCSTRWMMSTSCSDRYRS